MRSLNALCIVIAAMTLSSCATSTPPSAPQPDPMLRLVIDQACRHPGPLDDDTFGATTRKLLEVAGILAECRAAAQGLLTAR